MRNSLTALLLMASAMAFAQQSAEKTTFQTSSHWKPLTDIRTDLVMCYGTETHGDGSTFEQRVASWREKGYKAHFMTGIAWGEYKDYFTGQWDGKRHLDEGQKTQAGDTIWHGHMVPYIVPSRNFLEYMKQRHIKRAIDAGIDAIFLEEPEFWARAGYSEAFQREWQDYYGFPWRPQHESAENTYLSNKLKYHLYYRALDEAFSFAKAYGKEKGMDVRCFVPTHSLVNYSQWQIVSPEASLASLQSVDGYIAQVWTGTSREPNYFNGKQKERVFETAYLEYGCMKSMTAPTGRKMFFLTDPIEDRAKDWEDYKRNYQATFTAQLLYPEVADYEVMPWPDRIYEGLYKKSASSNEYARIPRFYSTQMQVMVNALGQMPVSRNKLDGTRGVAVLMANSMMFQRSPHPVEGYDDPQLSNFYGLALPLLKRGVPVDLVHLENTSFPQTWEGVKVLLMSYAHMKPLEEAQNVQLAEWVKKGGCLLYSGRDDDPFQGVQEWWNQGTNHFYAPSAHLFQLLGMPLDAPEGTYRCGKGKVMVLRHDPKEYVLHKGGDRKLWDAVETILGKPLEQKNSFTLRRGVYRMDAVLDEGMVSDRPLEITGRYIDLFDPSLPTLTAKTVRPGEQSLLLDMEKVKNPKKPQVLAAASRQYEERVTGHSFSFTSKSPAETSNVMRILLPREPQSVKIENTTEQSWKWDGKEGFNTLLLQFENNPDGVRVDITF